VTISENNIGFDRKIICLTELVWPLGNDLNREGAKDAKELLIFFSDQDE